jgi:chromate transporter
VTDTAATKRGRLTELLFYFLRVGVLGFGGPVALVGQMEREVVADRPLIDITGHNDRF